MGAYVRPLVEHVDSNKPLSIALEEIAADKIIVHHVGDPRRTAEELLGGSPDDESATELVGDQLVSDQLVGDQLAGDQQSGEDAAEHDAQIVTLGSGEDA